jgi:hypothetical protein
MTAKPQQAVGHLHTLSPSEIRAILPHTELTYIKVHKFNVEFTNINDGNSFRVLWNIGDLSKPFDMMVLAKEGIVFGDKYIDIRPWFRRYMWNGRSRNTDGQFLIDEKQLKKIQTGVFQFVWISPKDEYLEFCAGTQGFLPPDIPKPSVAYQISLQAYRPVKKDLHKLLPIAVIPKKMEDWQKISNILLE